MLEAYGSYCPASRQAQKKSGCTSMQPEQIDVILLVVDA